MPFIAGPKQWRGGTYAQQRMAQRQHDLGRKQMYSNLALGAADTLLRGAGLGLGAYEGAQDRGLRQRLQAQQQGFLGGEAERRRGWETGEREAEQKWQETTAFPHQIGVAETYSKHKPVNISFTDTDLGFLQDAIGQGVITPDEANAAATDPNKLAQIKGLSSFFGELPADLKSDLAGINVKNFGPADLSRVYQNPELFAKMLQSLWATPETQQRGTLDEILGKIKQTGMTPDLGALKGQLAPQFQWKGPEREPGLNMGVMGARTIPPPTAKPDLRAIAAAPIGPSDRGPTIDDDIQRYRQQEAIQRAIDLLTQQPGMVPQMFQPTEDDEIRRLLMEMSKGR